MSIAGHVFDLSGRCSCQRTFASIAGVRPEDIGQKGWAHTGDLTTKEYDEIVVERERLWKAHLESGVD